VKKTQVESRRSKVESPKSQDAGRKTTRKTSTRDPAQAVALDLAVPETLLAKLALSSPSRDPAAAALSFLLERFKQPALESAALPHERPFPARKV